MSKINIDSKMIGHIPTLIVSQEENKHKNLPLVIFYHGWQINKKLILTQGRKLAEAGFRAVLPDAQNHGSRYQVPDKIPSMTFFNSIHSNLFEFGYIVNYITRTFGQPEFIGVGGLSMGGMTTAALLTHHPEINAAAILMGTATLTEYRDQLLEYATHAGYWLPDDYKELTNWIPAYDLAKHTDRIGDRPVYIWHGRQDKLVPFDLMEKFVTENPQLNLEVVFQDREHLVEVDTMIDVTAFFKKQLTKD